MEGEPSAQMPRYRSHKEVWALQIDRVEDAPHPSSKIVHFVRSDVYAPRKVDMGVFSRKTPERGDYFVVYRDGYESWSPKSEFEDGYTLAP
jgi:hypothetical protein